MSSREERLRADYQALTVLRAASDVFDFEAHGDPPDRYTVLLRGKGVAREGNGPEGVEFLELHRIEIRLPFSYPELAPDVRWLTPILHPNVSFSGFLDLVEIGLPWRSDVALEVVCERLWDMARLAYVNPERVSNYAAKNWQEKECRLALPIDERPLCNRGGSNGENVIHYRRKGQTGEGAVEPNRELLIIDENTPIPELPAAAAMLPIPRGAARDAEGEVLYIGEDS